MLGFKDLALDIVAPSNAVAAVFLEGQQKLGANLKPRQSFSFTMQANAAIT